ncbi:MAG: hypothetical protein QW702_03180 [Candidatus Bathyarchaeia archaeon]
MSRNIFAMIFAVLMAAVTVLAVTWGFEFNWPDYVHVDYGFPLVWCTHTLNTIHGPVDVWRVDLAPLTADLAFWLSIMIMGLFIILLVKR